MAENSEEWSGLWGGRFTAAPDADIQAFGASLPVDRRLWAEDIQGSLAHARMLGAVGVLSAADVAAIAGGLERIAAAFAAGSVQFSAGDEDIHTVIERLLVADIGEAGKRLHTGRSRNDQVACDTRLYLKKQLSALLAVLQALRQVLVDQATTHQMVILPGFTHLQAAQPVLLSHHLLAYFWMFSRDQRRLQAAWTATNISPLGAAALAGTSYPLDSEQTARELGFVDEQGRALVIPNSMDAVSDRDYLLDALYAAATTQMHLSRLAEELVLWSSQPFGFITLADAYATGSSIMPQKKNPDFAELVRGKTGRIYGDLLALLTVLKGLPLTYNKDLQEDKSLVFDALDNLALCLQTMSGMLNTWTVHSDRMLEAANRGYMAATDLADWLVRRGLPFREAHSVVGHLVLVAEARGVGLADLTEAELQAASPILEASALTALDSAGLGAARRSYGGTAPQRVQEQLELARVALSDQPVQ